MAETVLRWIGFAAGLLLLGFTLHSIVTTVIMPRSSRSGITLKTWQMVQHVFIFVANRQPGYERKDRILALLAPISLLAALVTWLLLLFVSYGLLFWPLIPGSLGDAMFLSGSSMFTLGVASARQPGPILLEFIAAATGLVVVALQIGYLPTLYSAFNRRETLVTSLSMRAGAPPWGPEVLVRHQLNQSIDTLPGLYAAWETWAADIAESHSSYPWLMAFRSPSPRESWLLSLLAVLDSANLYMVLSPTLVPAEARQCMRMGYMCLRFLATSVDMPVNSDPLPTDPIHLTYEQFAEGVEHLRLAGFPLERTAEEAWPDFRGWRVNYEEVAYRLADYFVIVPAPWSGPRSFAPEEPRFEVLTVRPPHRTPDDPEGQAARRMRVGTERARVS